MPEVSDYDRGHTAGGIAERLDGHDRHFAAINGSLARMVDEMHAMTLALQHLSDQAKARDATAIATATALEKDEATRRAARERRWSPFARLMTLIGGVAALAAIVTAWLTWR